MLEVKNLKKIYKTKNGADVHALDGVTLRFPETGMVFLLGKSGSGKSTLLNVCGGLDSPSEGEIIVKGRSSKDFSQSDFDSYRNTFVGFIFQEYNILNEFTVEDNIALALELQGKPKDKAAINALLKEVDLEGYAKRKPNTLSGGQKQRIAIARALVKAPEIIMADEPTGALDSKTGKQVFDTLKKLSKDKLVIVVSHDREFAEQYGDRIIELMDGKVLEDISKTEIQQQAVSANVNTIGDVLCVKRGADLTDKDFDEIKAFLKRSGDDVIIANNPKDVENFKKVSMINDKGEKEVFRETVISDDDIKKYSKEDSRFIRSKLPLRHAFKIGVSGLKSKPVRLFFTILLCTVAFVLFGLLSTLNFYDSEATFRQTLKDSDISVMQVKKEYKTDVTWFTNGEKDYSYDSVADARFNNADIEKFAETLGKDVFGAAISYTNYNVRNNQSSYWVNGINAFAYIDENNSLRGKINGEYPKNKDEIVISSYAADMFKACEVYGSDGSPITLKTAEDIIGKKIVISGNEFKVTGIFDSGVIPEEFIDLQNSESDNMTLEREYEAYLGDSLHLVAFVDSERLEKFSNETFWKDNGILDYTNSSVTLENNGKYEFPEYGSNYYAKIDSMPKTAKMFYIGEEKKTLSDGEIIVSERTLAAMMNVMLRNTMEDLYSKGEDADQTILDTYNKLSELCSEIEIGGKFVRDEDTNKEEIVPFTEKEMNEKINSLIALIKQENISLKAGMRLFDMYNNTFIGDVSELNIVGVCYQKTEDYVMQYRIYVSDGKFDALWNEQKGSVVNYSETKSKYQEPEDAFYSILYVPYEYSEAAVDTYWSLYNANGWGADESRIYLSGNYIGSLKMIDELVSSMSKIFLYVGLGFALFAVLLFSNFISVSISQKRREIGILRAVGARSADVFKIFFSESFVIAVICIAISTALSVIVCNILNREVGAEIGASIFVFGITSFAIMVGVALLTAIIATFLPVFNAAKKKPVDSIRAI